MMVSRPRTAVSMMNCRSPIAPSSSSARTRRLIGSRRKFSATDSTLPLRSRRGDDAVAAADGQRQRFLAQGVQTQVEQIAGDQMMRPGIGRAGGRLQPIGLPDHGRQIGEDGRPAAEERLAPRRPDRRAFRSLRSQTATRSTARSPQRASSASPARCRRPIPPQPTMASRTGSAVTPRPPRP